jgi:hypothetical protein
MRGVSNRTTGRVLACLALLGGAGIGGLAAGWTASAGRVADHATTIRVAEMAPADIVNLRFPADWGEASEAATPARLAFASADGSITLFNPKPMYAVASAAASEPPPPVQTPAPVAAPAKPKPATQQTAAAAPAAATPNPAPARIQLASATSKPVVHAKPARPNAVLNDSQIASIKRRLALTSDQERYWPAVEAELRKMEYTKGANGKSTQGTKMAQIDISKMDVDGLKSAGFPMVMSFSDDQRRELKSLVHLLGLDSVMSGL